MAEKRPGYSVDPVLTMDPFIFLDLEREGRGKSKQSPGEVRENLLRNCIDLFHQCPRLSATARLEISPGISKMIF